MYMKKRIIKQVLSILILLGLSFGMFDGVPFIMDNLSKVTVVEAAIAELYWPVRDVNGTSITALSSNHGVGGHKGIDIKNSSGCNWYAAYGGVVYKKYEGCVTNANGNHAGCSPNHGRWNGYCNDGFGNGIVIRCNIGGTNYYMQYAHMASVSSGIREGQMIEKGTYLGIVGDRGYSYGPHAHFEIDRDSLFGTAVNNDPTQGSCQFSYNYNSPENLPQGCVDEIACVGDGKIRVRGWAFDRDNPGISLEIHIYIGGSDEGHAIIANKSRTDVNTAYPGVGNNHGFEEVINTKKSGNQTVDIFAINIRKDGSQLGYANPVIGQKTIHVSADTTKPTISSIHVFGITRGYYTVTATASDDTGVTDVKFATWSSKNGQDDLKWTTGRKINASTWEGLIQVSDHNMERGEYITHVYAYDAAGNDYGKAAPVVQIPDVTENVDTNAGDSFEAHIVNIGAQNYLCQSEKNVIDNKHWDVLSGEYNGKNLLEKETWIFSRQSDGYYTIQNKYSGKYLDIAYSSKNPGANVILSDLQADSENDNQKFRLYKSAKGYFITSKCTPYTVLDINNHQSGTSVCANYYSPANTNQIFSIVRLDNTGDDSSGMDKDKNKGEDREVVLNNEVKPGKVTALKVKKTAGKKSITAKWKKVSGAKGYQIQYALSKKKLKKGKKKNVQGTRVTIKKLKKRGTYYFRVRAYKSVGKGNVYGKWSAIKRIKIKK